MKAEKHTEFFPSYIITLQATAAVEARRMFCFVFLWMNMWNFLLLLMLLVIFTFSCDSQCSTTWILWMSADCFERQWAAAPCTDIWQHGFVHTATPLCFCIDSAGHGEKHLAVPVPSVSPIYLCAELAEPAYLLHWISSSKRDWN